MNWIKFSLSLSRSLMKKMMLDLVVSILLASTLFSRLYVSSIPTDCIYVDSNQAVVRNSLGLFCYFSNNDVKSCLLRRENVNNNENDEGNLIESMLQRRQNQAKSTLFKVTRLKRPPWPFRIGGKVGNRISTISRKSTSITNNNSTNLLFKNI